MAILFKLVHEDVVNQTWSCLQQPVYKHGLFDTYFFNHEILEETAAAAKISFCPSLTEVIQGAKPPDIHIFETRPTEISKQ
ncbi:hypothetical protein PMZ80_007070 [Knufia obscura]|uniref:Uncharacterized protein n=2 Tax=Knufia TaxID=430999 RepID=A0AAN8EDI5_9EURO|nr:hypothetical protein PMZ80_007070 [Knufia obscura]KAK5953079.1 hypothetical protein OHC33_005647 [Knufia fluminis]